MHYRHQPSSSPRHYERGRSSSQEIDDDAMGHSRSGSPSGSSASEHDKSEQTKLPSLKEFCSGRIPPSESTLDQKIRGLGIDHPLPPRSLSVLSCKNATFAWPDFALRQKTDGLLYQPHYQDSRPSSSSSHYAPHEYKHRPKMVRQRSTSYSSRDESPHSGHVDVDSSMDSDSDCDSSYASRLHDTFQRACFLQKESKYQGGPYTHSRARSFDSESMDFSLSAVEYTQPANRRHFRREVPSTQSSPYDRYSSRELPAENPLAHLDWEDYVEKTGRIQGAGPVMYTCRWQKENGQTCNYTGKKQLAKRHVESVHMAKKPHICKHCQKPFPQKTSLDIHIRSVHTFDKPLKCDHCSACFSDPARRHKHYRVEHPDKVIKKARNKLEYEKIKDQLVADDKYKGP
ncbi:hypothetical protein FA15DRAFT_664796 [Coprinopsis marcescibilis]|uniref:C2H2-type domain-containing protein n=1 Tax=Coprinopsis marcescibilis TaxID=230819 RepID=A0A5C3L7Z0_COPMA|nr:hypothetical protein FA15DRAFT_664796 [Coprinopsis marcescibilis]